MDRLSYKKKLNGFAILSLGNEILTKLEYKNVISNFASPKVGE
jgi:hypothetical protein